MARVTAPLASPTMKFSYDQDEDPNKDSTTVQDPENLPQLVLQDIKISMNANINRKRQCLFFHIVNGGNVNMVHAILKFLDEGEHTTELNWVLNRRGEVIEYTGFNCWHRLVQFLIFLITLAVFIITTPLFYLLHAAGIGLHSATRNSISEDPKLPLLFALRSKRPEMVIMFLEVGVTIEDVDDNNNNIYHYLSDLSSSNPDDAIQYHKLLMSCVKDMEQFKDVILRQENILGLSPMEFCSRYGSMKFAEQLFLQKGLMRETLVSVSDSSVWIDEQYLSKMSSSKYVIGMISSNESNTRDTCTNSPQQNLRNLEIAEYDLHRYEHGETLGHQSYLLQLIASRKVEEMSEDDIDSFLNVNFLHSWIKRKRRRFMFPCIVSHLIQVLVTILLLLYLLHFGGDMNPFPLLEKLVDNYLKVSLEHLIDKLDYDANARMLNKTRATPSMMSATVDYQTNSNAATSYFTEEDLNSLNVGDLTLICNNKTETFGGYLLNQCLSKALAIVMEECEQMRLEDALKFSGVKLFFDAPNMEGLEFNWILSLSMEVFMLCHMFIDLIYRITFLVRNFKSTTSFPYVTILPLITRRFPGSYIEKQLNLLMYALYTIYLVIFWLLERRLRSYLVTAFDDNIQSTFDGIQGDVNSVTVQQTSFSSFSADIHVQISKERLLQGIYEIEKSSFVTQQFIPKLNEDLRIMSYLLIACLIVRFLLAVHVMRLLPGVGFFVITARKMAQHLIEFVLVYLLVAVAFATIFHFVMRDPDCPANKVEGFLGMAEGLFSTYLIALGQAEFNFFHNTNAQIAFVVYTVITVLLLFNLIIAVMSTTADALNRKCRRKALCILEMWDETLGVEATCQVMTLPFECCMSLCKRVVQLARTKSIPDKYRYDSTDLPTMTVTTTTTV